MKFSLSLVAAFFAVTSLAAPSSTLSTTTKTSVAATQTSSSPWSPLTTKSTSKPTAKATAYGPFKYPILPNLPKPNWKPIPILPANSTTEDVRLNPQLSHGPSHRGHWSPGFSVNTNTLEKCPNTGRTVRYTFTITNTTLAPDGIEKQMLVVNGQYPGPAVVANWGDYIEITVINALKYNGTGMHWHGLRQFRNNLADGAGGATECPIAPGGSRVYRFQATSYGTSWYHSHFSVQYGDGVVGPIIINGPSSANYDIDAGHVLITDWYPRTAPQEDYYAHRRGPPEASNYLINGKNVTPDGKKGKRAQFLFTPGKTHLLRLVNTGMDNSFRFSIDGHRLRVIMTDFVPIVPYYTNEVALAIGQRYHVLVEANQKPGNYYARAMANLDCSPSANPGTGIANAVVSYLNANLNALPSSTATNHVNTCIDEPIESLIPIVSEDVPSSGFQTIAKVEEVDLVVTPEKRKRSPQAPPGGGPTGGAPPGGAPPGGAPGGGPPGNIVFQWTLGGISQVLDWKNPIIAQSVRGNNTYEQPRNVLQLTKANAWTYWVIQNKFFVPHPMHLHGHDFNLLGQGNGIFNINTDMSKLNFKNPARRDVAMLVAQGWTVISFKTDNPGAWLMHCHIAWHAGEGLSLNFLERPQDIPALYGQQVRNEVEPSCKKFAKYEETAVWVQYDSGLKRRAIDGTVDWAASKFIQAKERMYWAAKRENMIRRRL